CLDPAVGLASGGIGCPASRRGRGPAGTGRRRPSMRHRVVLVQVMVVAALGASALPAHAADPATGALVSVGSPTNITPPNHQNEPAVAVDANHPNVLVSGSNDYIDQPVCPRDLMAVSGRCDAFATGAGLSGVYFSFDSGHSWM